MATWRWRLAQSSCRMSLQISCTIASLCSARCVMPSIRPSRSAMAACVFCFGGWWWLGDQFIQHPPLHFHLHPTLQFHLHRTSLRLSLASTPLLSLASTHPSIHPPLEILSSFLRLRYLCLAYVPRGLLPRPGLSLDRRRHLRVQHAYSHNGRHRCTGHGNWISERCASSTPTAAMQA